MDFLRGLGGGGFQTRLVGIPGRAVGQFAQADGFARAGEVAVGHEDVELGEGRDDFLAQGRGGFLAQARAVGCGKLRGKFGEGLDDGVLLQVINGLAFDLGGHVAQGDARGRDAVGQALLQQDDGLVHQGGEGLEAGDHVLIILHGVARGNGQGFGHLLLHPGHLGDGHVFAWEARPLDAQLKAALEKIAVQLIGRAQGGAVDGGQGLQRGLEFPLAPRDGLERFVRPAVIETGAAGFGGHFRVLAQIIVPLDFEKLAEAVGVLAGGGGDFGAILFKDRRRLGRGGKTACQNKGHRKNSFVNSIHAADNTQKPSQSAMGMKSNSRKSTNATQGKTPFLLRSLRSFAAINLPLAMRPPQLKNHSGIAPAEGLCSHHR